MPFSVDTIINDETAERKLQEKNDELEAEITILRNQLKQHRFCFDAAAAKGLVQYYTSLNPKTFSDLVSLIKLCKVTGYSIGNTMSVEDEIFMVLIKLRHNFGFDDLSLRFAVSRFTLRRMFYNILYILHSVVYVEMVEKSFPTLEQIQHSLKPEVYADFPNVRVIVDCTEMKCPAPPGMNKKAEVYSNYKSNYTYKGLVGIAPNGKIIICE